MTTDLIEIRLGRNFVRIGDTVKCSPHVGRRFLARVLSINEVDGTVQVTVYGGPAGRALTRTFTTDRISRVAQTRHQERAR